MRALLLALVMLRRYVRLCRKGISTIILRAMLGLLRVTTPQRPRAREAAPGVTVPTLRTAGAIRTFDRGPRGPWIRTNGDRG